eukprot:7131220-Pyramimonas_sp.AAC.1
MEMGIIPGYRDPSRRDRKHHEEPRAEAFYSSSTYIRGAQPNPHTFVTPYKFNRYKNEVEIVVDMHIATQSGCI